MQRWHLSTMGADWVMIGRCICVPCPCVLTSMPLRSIFLAGLLLAAAAAQAHDTWFHALPAVAGAPVLALGTGNRFPVQESGVGTEFLARQGCSLIDAPKPAEAGRPLRESRKVAKPHFLESADGRSASQPLMRPLHNVAHALILRGPPRAQSCWAQLVPLEVELAADKVAIYLREVQADPALRATWADMQRRGVPWKERYTKHARIDFSVVEGEPVPMAMDIVREASANGSLSFRVLRDGQPVPGLAMEWVSDTASLGIWRRSDAEGRVRVPALPPGRWVLRAIDLRLSMVEPDRWESRFVTLAFEVPLVTPSPATAASTGAMPNPR